MSVCNFTISFSQSPEELISKVRKGISGTGGTFTGDVTSGNIVLSTPIGTIKGNYTITIPSLKSQLLINQSLLAAAE